MMILWFLKLLPLDFFPIHEYSNDAHGLCNFGSITDVMHHTSGFSFKVIDSSVENKNVDFLTNVIVLLNLNLTVKSIWAAKYVPFLSRGRFSVVSNNRKYENNLSCG